MQIPPIVLTVVTAHLNSLLHWFSNEMYRRLLASDQDHFLVHLHEALDCEPLEKACAHYHHSSGPGSPVTHSVPHLVRALLVKYLFDRSLRQLEHDIRWNLLVKWFVGYALFQPGPDHSTLERFELWVCQHQARTLFDEVLRQIDQDFPVERCHLAGYNTPSSSRQREPGVRGHREPPVRGQREPGVRGHREPPWR